MAGTVAPNLLAVLTKEAGKEHPPRPKAWIKGATITSIDTELYLETVDAEDVVFDIQIP
jgi:hypothetical protein